MKITFLGAAGTVTGSLTLVEADNLRLLVDCGMFQGLKELRLRNREPFAFDPASIDCVLLTHGHLDHCGLLPKLVSEGFRGDIFCSAPTKEIVKLILEDSAKIQEEEAEMANRGEYSRHHPARPLYRLEDARRIFPMLKAVDPEIKVRLTNDAYAVFTNSGHIMGACSILLSAGGRTVVFSGDIGQDDDPLMLAPEVPAPADAVIMESTYGDRLHPEEDPLILLEAVVGNALRAGGTVIIPGFAVGRAQTLMYLLWKLRMEDRLPDVPFVLDTPMGADMLAIMANHRRWHKLNPEEFRGMCDLFIANMAYSETIETIFDPQPKVVIAASGMLTGGRVLSYLEHYLDNPKTCIVMIGFQAEGTRGRQLLEGEDQIKIRGKYYPVRANVVQIEGLSAHGDQGDLLKWLSRVKISGSTVRLVHGEPQASRALAEAIGKEFGYDVSAVQKGERLNL